MKEEILLIGDGFIGNKLVEKLVEKGYQLNIVSLSTGHDITDRAKMFELISEFQGKKVILMAAIADLNVFEANPALGLDVNVGGVCNVALACSTLHKKLYYISTCCAYGNTPDLPSREVDRVCPSEIYASCKVAGEWIIDGFHKSYDLEYVNLRVATTFGPTMRGALAPAVFINQINEGKHITIHGDGKQTRTMTYIDDEVSGIAAVVDSDITNETVNVSTDEEVSVLQMAQIIKEEMGKPDWPITFVKDRKGQTAKEQIDISKIRRLTGWTPKWTFRDGIKETLKWMKAEKIEKI